MSLCFRWFLLGGYHDDAVITLILDIDLLHVHMQMNAPKKQIHQDIARGLKAALDWWDNTYYID